MQNHIFTVRGRFGLALAAALLAGSMGLPASAPAADAPQQAARLNCNPSFDNCFELLTWYSDANHSTVTGYGRGDCNGGYVVLSGFETQWNAITGWGFCPD